MLELLFVVGITVWLVAGGWCASGATVPIETIRAEERAGWGWLSGCALVVLLIGGFVLLLAATMIAA